jgi:hypothetical protein
MWLFKLILIVGAVSVALLVLIHVAQTRILFPTRFAEMYKPVLPASAIRIEIEAGDGTRLRGVHIPAASGRSGEPVLLGFGGNAWNADSLAEYLHGLFPDAAVVTFHYRGYRPSGGRPSAAALLADAPTVHDHVVGRLDYHRVIAVGFSIGSGVAASLASQRPLAGLILVSPFDSLEAMAREHYPWAPGWLLRHRIATAEYLRGVTAPTAVIAAENDTIVPPRRVGPVRHAVADLVFDRTIAGADHNDLYERPAFQAAMVEALARISAAVGERRALPPHSP